MIRIAAVGDVHYGLDSRGLIDGYAEQLQEEADVLLIAGDLTRVGDPAEAEVLAHDLARLRIPRLAVLGNHDHHGDRPDEIVRILSQAGVQVLEGEGRVVEIRGTTLGVAGVKGFGGGFAGACATEFGEPLMKSFVHHSQERADALESALAGLEADHRVALLHYSPVEATLVGEAPALWPFLGTYLLAQAIDRAGADLALHGHAHAGAHRGATPAGVPVRNVAQPVIGRAYDLYQLGGEAAPD